MKQWRSTRFFALLLTGWNIGVGQAASVPPVRLECQAEGMTSPISLVEMPDGRRLIVDQIGVIHVLDKNWNPQKSYAADFRNRMIGLNRNYDERGLLDLALHPQVESNDRVFVFYSAPKANDTPHGWDGTSVLAEYRIMPGMPLQVDMASEKVLMRFSRPYGNHNGGRMAFGPDGLLYIGVGDGGAANDQGLRPPEGNAQHLQTWMGKILRIDVDRGDPYAIPPDNPFAEGKQGLPEIYAYGLRNPWGLSFDREGKQELFEADVGQNLFEEVNIIIKGGNYGWNLREGFHPFDVRSPGKVPATGKTQGRLGEKLLDPILEYPHRSPSPADVQGISITGGYVYRGKAIPGLSGRYVFADWARKWGGGDGRLLVGTRSPKEEKWELAELSVSGKNWKSPGPYIIGMGQGRDGELYVFTNDGLTPRGDSGKIWQILPGE